MPHLDTRGDIAAAEIAFYLPIAAVSLVLFIRHGFKRDAGWLFLFIFSATRIARGALLVAAEMVQPTNVDLFTAAYVIDASALAPLILATLGFMGLAGQRTYSEHNHMMRIFRSLGALALVALALSVAGGVVSTNANSGTSHTGTILRRVAAATFGGLYVLLALVLMMCWSYHYELGRRRRKILSGVTVAFPFLGARVAYAIIAAWSSSDLYGAHLSPNQTLARLNPVTGGWVLYLVLSLIMEYVVALIYTITGLAVPLRRDRR